MDEYILGIALSVGGSVLRAIPDLLIAVVIFLVARAVVGAAITVTNVETNASVRLTSNATGYYEANLLLPGSYQVSVDATGFKKYARSGIVLSLSTRMEITIALEVGSLTESISVTAAAPMLSCVSNHSAT